MKSLKSKIKKYLRPILANINSKLRKRILGDYAIGVVCDTANGVLVVNPYDVVVGRQLSHTGRYDVEKLDRISKLIDQDRSILVVGTHVGALLIPLASRCRQIVGYEANPDTYRLLELNVILNRLENVEIYNLAAGESQGIIEFWANNVNTGGSKRKPKIEAQEFMRHDLERKSVEMVALDIHLDGRSFDMIIMDIEGSEYYALQGMQKMLETCSYLQVEFLPDSINLAANIKVNAFLDLISPHFEFALDQDTLERIDKKHFLEYMESLLERNIGTDLLFSKSPLDAY